MLEKSPDPLRAAEGTAPHQLSGPAVVLIEDEPQIRRFLRAALVSQGYRLFEAATGQDGLSEAATRQPDIIILDLGLPDIDGLEVIKRLREWTAVPIIVLSARGQEQDKIGALDAGADDYVSKPFGMAELRSRIRAVLRRAGPRAMDDDVLAVGPLVLDRSRREVTVDGRQVALTFAEFELLVALMIDPGHLLNRLELLRAIWGESAYRDPRGIDVHVRHLREKLEHQPESPRLILTVRGIGYRLAVA